MRFSASDAVLTLTLILTLVPGDVPLYGKSYVRSLGYVSLGYVSLGYVPRY